MAIMKMKKIRELGEKEFTEKRRELALELSKERASSEIGGTVKNPGRIREIRRTLARMQGLSLSKQRAEEIAKKKAVKTTAKVDVKEKKEGREKSSLKSGIDNENSDAGNNMKDKNRGDGK